MNGAVLFQGQGNYDTFHIKNLIGKRQDLKKLWDDADQILGWSISDLLRQTDNAGRLPTKYAQPIIFLMQYTAWYAYKNELQEKIQYLAGHSLGELVALAAAEVFSFEDALKLVGERGHLMQLCLDEVEQGMLVLNECSAYQADLLCEEAEMVTKAKVYCANYNSGKQTVISGEKIALDYVRQQSGLDIRELPVTKAFHTPLMKAAAIEFMKCLEKVKFFYPKIPVLSNVTAHPYQATWTIKNLLCKQIYSPVYWNEIMEYFRQKGITVFLQPIENNVFKNMGIEGSKFIQWKSFEEIARGKLIDFDNTYYNTSKKEMYSEELCGEILVNMIADPWRTHSEEDISKIKEAYRRVEIIAIKGNYSENEINKCMEDLKLVLTLKGIDEHSIFERSSRLLRKYGII